MVGPVGCGVTLPEFSNAGLARDVADKLDDLKGDSAREEIAEPVGIWPPCRARGRNRGQA